MQYVHWLLAEIPIGEFHMNDSDQIKNSWEKRQLILGNTQRSVLYKNLPSSINSSLHKRHVKFITEYIQKRHTSVLDVGCGYGRLTSEVQKLFPKMTFNGVEICKPFADYYQEHYGNCYNSSVEDFRPEREYDVILIVTVLMYIKPDMLRSQLEKLWSCLAAGGKVICIEQSDNFLISARKKLNISKFTPTGDTPTYFENDLLNKLFLDLENCHLEGQKKFRILPAFPAPVMHKGYVYSKTVMEKA